ncbi:EamA family transporter [Acinetobacter baumannii]
MGAVILLPALLITGGGLLQEFNKFTCCWLYDADSYVFGLFAFGFGLKTVNASQATTLLYLNLLLQRFLPLFLVGESVSWIGWAGMFLIFICILMLSKPENT